MGFQRRRIETATDIITGNPAQNIYRRKDFRRYRFSDTPDGRISMPVIRINCGFAPGGLPFAPLGWRALNGPSVQAALIHHLSMSQEQNGVHPPSTEEIAYFAYLIWEKEGRPCGREKEHWLQAETQLLATRAHEQWTAPRQPTNSPS